MLTAANRNELTEKGYTVVKNVLTLGEADHYYSEMWSWLERTGLGIRRDDRSTWHNRPISSKGVINGYESAYARYVIEIRSHPQVVATFGQLWGTDELLSSQDAVNMMIPLPKRGHGKSKPWMHTDQGCRDVGLQCVQGFVNLLPCGPDDGGLIVLPGSHLRHQTFFQNHPDLAIKARKGLILPESYRTYPELADLGDEIKVCANAGDLVLWDSRTFHHSTLPANRTAIRAAVYTCLLPARLATDKDLANKKKAWEARRLTNHWATRANLLPADVTRTLADRAAYRSLPLPKDDLTTTLTPRVQRLFGLLPYPVSK